MTAWRVEGNRGDLMVGKAQEPVWRNDIDVVALQIIGSLDLTDLQSGARGNDSSELAAALRIQVNDDDKGSTGILGHVGEEVLQRVDAAGGSADADNRRLRRVPFGTPFWPLEKAFLLCHGAPPPERARSTDFSWSNDLRNPRPGSAKSKKFP